MAPGGDPPHRPNVLVRRISTKVSSVYQVALPSEVNDFLDAITGWISFGMTGIADGDRVTIPCPCPCIRDHPTLTHNRCLAGIATTPLECIGAAGYGSRLVFCTSPAARVFPHAPAL